MPGDLQYVDYGLSAFRSEAFSVLDAGAPADLAVVNARLIARHELIAYFVDERPYEIGSPEGLRETESYLDRL
jgi:hypothetical protein